MFMGTRTNLPGWGFQRRNALSSLGFPECRGPAKRPDPSLCSQCRGHGGDSPAGEPRTPRSGQLMSSWIKSCIMSQVPLKSRLRV